MGRFFKQKSKEGNDWLLDDVGRAASDPTLSSGQEPPVLRPRSVSFEEDLFAPRRVQMRRRKSKFCFLKRCMSRRADKLSDKKLAREMLDNLHQRMEEEDKSSASIIEKENLTQVKLLGW